MTIKEQVVVHCRCSVTGKVVEVPGDFERRVVASLT